MQRPNNKKYAAIVAPVAVTSSLRGWQCEAAGGRSATDLARVDEDLARERIRHWSGGRVLPARDGDHAEQLPMGSRCGGRLR